MRHGIKLVERSIPWESTMPKAAVKRAIWAPATAVWRLGQIPTSYTGSMTLIQRQLFPGYFSPTALFKGPRVLDVDDAIWLTRGGSRVPELARSCEAVICGNKFLMEYFQQFNSNVKMLPTAVDTDAIMPAESDGDRPHQVIGWTGSSDNYKFVYAIEGALAQVLEANPKAQLLFVSDKPPEFSTIPPRSVEFVKWSVRAESEALRRMTVGIMPLDDTLWSRGKCSFKMLIYMAAGIPIVASPVGMNADVLQMGEIGYGAMTESEWTQALDHLLRNSGEARRRGGNAREVAVKNFSLDVLGARLASQLFEIEGSGQRAAPLC
jgi:glycosyltransferase involved in cell wall biosynthesis